MKLTVFEFDKELLNPILEKKAASNENFEQTKG